MSESSESHNPWALCVITARTPHRDHLDLVRAAVEGGAPMVQLRAKDLPDRELFRLAERARALTRAAGVRYIINDRLDVALAVEADGVHLGPDDLPWAAARRAAPGLCIGASVSNLSEASQADAAGVHYLGAGPVFGTATKMDAGAPLGLDGLRAICAATRLPVLGIGGITVETVGAPVAAGARGVAVVSAVSEAEDPVQAVRLLLASIRRAEDEERA